MIPIREITLPMMGTYGGWINIFSNIWVTELEKNRLYVGLLDGLDPNERAKVQWFMAMTRVGDHGATGSFRNGEERSVCFVYGFFEHWVKKCNDRVTAENCEWKELNGKD